jgi:hypothetical protein
MTKSKSDEVADELAQIIFRLETNFNTYGKHTVIEDKPSLAIVLNDAIINDFERLKLLKNKIENWI